MPQPAKDSAAAPDLSPMVVLVGRWGVGHACPVGPRILYTAGHVTDERPFDEDIALFPLRMQAGDLEDTAVPVEVDRTSDTALLRPLLHPIEKWFPRVAEPPKVGERLWDIGYQWASRHDFAHPRVIDAKVSRVVAGHVFLMESAGPGSSGSCWVNARGEAVAINVWGMDCESGPAALCAVAVGLWPPWQFPNEEEPAAMDPESIP